MPDDIGGIHCVESFERMANTLPDDMDLWIVLDLWRRAWDVDGDEIVQKLIPASYDCSLNCENDGGVSVLHICALRNHAGSCRLLLAHDGFIKSISVDSRGETALHYAAKHGNFDACKAILGSDRFVLAGVNAVSGAGRRAVEETSMHEIRDLFISSIELKSSLLWKMVSTESLDDAAVVSLIEMADPLALNYENEEGATLLHALALHNLAFACTTLLNHPEFTKANNRNHWGETPLHLGARGGLHKVCQAILSNARFNDMTIDVVCHNNATARDLAANEQIGDMIRQRKLGLNSDAKVPNLRHGGL